MEIVWVDYQKWQKQSFYGMSRGRDAYFNISENYFKGSPD